MTNTENIVRGLREHIAELQSKIEKLNAKIQAAELTIRSLEENPQVTESLFRPQTGTSIVLKPQQAVEKILR